MISPIAIPPSPAIERAETYAALPQELRMILALDPSSTLTGYAILSLDRKLIDAGRLRPTRTRDDANTRILAMAADLYAVSNDNPAISQVVIEDTSGKVARRHGAGGGAGLAIHGKAIGALWFECRRIFGGGIIEMVKENDWACGTSKGKRQQRIMLEFGCSGYDAAQDKGGDTADAIGLGLWWIGQQAIRRATL